MRTGGRHDCRVNTCPGCGVELPADDSLPAGSRYRASPECQHLCGEVAAYTSQQQALLGPWHQTCVDAYGGQHSGPDTPAITIAFALNGLYLVLERGLSGYQVREPHSYLASAVDSWPRLTPPDSVGEVTVLDVALASSPEEHTVLVQRWGRSVWTAWRHVHDEVAAMTDAQLRGWRPRQS